MAGYWDHSVRELITVEAVAIGTPLRSSVAPKPAPPVSKKLPSSCIVSVTIVDK